MASWKDVKARKRELDRAAGRDVEAASVEAETRTHAYVLGHRLSELRERASLSQMQVAKHMDVKQTSGKCDHEEIVSTSSVDRDELASI